MLSRRFEAMLLGGLAAVALAACSSGSSPTAPADWGPAMPTVSALPSAVVGGVVVDSANRPLAGVTIEWTATTGTSATSWGDRGREVETSADGAYGLVVGSADAKDDTFLVRATKTGYQSQQAEVKLAESCSWNESKCASTVNFVLSAE